MSHLPPKMNEDPRWRHMEDGDPAGSYNSATAEYNIDDPKFCTPMSVLSGLVSGFCERQAVVMTGNTIGGSAWQTAKTAAADAANGSTVESMTALVALGRDVGSTVAELANVVPSTDANFMMISAGTAGTYMQVFDGLLNLTITSGGYVDVTGATAYDTFAKVATVAVQAAQAAGQPIGTPVSGGLAYSGTMKPTLPTEWALERKWMMEVLRRTPGGAAETGPVQSGNNIYGSMFTDYWRYTERASVTAITQAAQNTNMNDVYALVLQNSLSYRYSNIGTYGDVSQITLVASATNWEAEEYTESVTGDPNAQVTIENILSVEKKELSLGLTCTTHAYKTVGTAGDSTEVVPMYIDNLHQSEPNQVIDYSSMTPVGSLETATSNSKYYVVAGGTLQIPANTLVSAVYVEPGGSVVMLASDSKIRTLNIMTGGVYKPFIETETAAIKWAWMGIDPDDYNARISYHYIPSTLEKASRYRYIAGNFNGTYGRQTATAYGDYRFLLVERTAAGTPTVNISAPFDPADPGETPEPPLEYFYIRNNGGKINVKGHCYVYAEIASGGTLSLSSQARVSRIIVSSGALLELKGGTQMITGDVTIKRGGSMSIVGPIVSLDPLLHGYWTLCCEDGATVNIASAAGMAVGLGYYADHRAIGIGFARAVYNQATGYTAVMGFEEGTPFTDLKNELDAWYYGMNFRAEKLNCFGVAISGGIQITNGWNAVVANRVPNTMSYTLFGEDSEQAGRATIQTADMALPIPAIGGTVYYREYGRRINYQSSCPDDTTFEVTTVELSSAGWQSGAPFDVFYANCETANINQGAVLLAINSAGPGTTDHYPDFNLRQSRTASEIPTVTPVEDEEEEEEEEDD